MIKCLAFLVVCLLLFVLPGRSQSKVSLSATVSPTFSHVYYNYHYFYPESDGQVVEPLYLNGSRWLSGYVAGLSVVYTNAPGWSVSSGLWFEQLTIRQNRLPAAGPGLISLHNRIVRFPLYVNYTSSAKRLSPYFSLGFPIDLPIPSRLVVERDGESTQHLRLLLPLNPVFRVSVGAGVRYQFTKRYTFVVQPVWTYNLGQIGGASTYDPSFEVGLSTQLIYGF